MNSLEIIKSLKQMNYDSINEAKSNVDGINGKNNSEKKVLSYLKDEYNKIVNYIQKQYLNNKTPKSNRNIK
jgi:hypothetical protein